MNMMLQDQGKLQENFWLINEISESAKVDLTMDQFNLVKQRYELFLSKEKMFEKIRHQQDRYDHFRNFQI